MTSYMTSGSLLKSIIPFFLSMTVSNIFSQVYNIVDSVIVGRYLGEKALAAVGTISAIDFLFSGIISGFPCAFAILTGQAFGAKDESGVRRSVCVSLIIMGTILIFFECLGQMFLTDLLMVMKTPEDILSTAIDYFRVTMIGMPILSFYNLFSSQMRMLGDSKRPVYVVIGTSILNALLDLLFVCMFHCGIKGAAWATTLSELISVLVCLYMILSSVSELHPKRETWINSSRLYMKHLNIAIPIAMQYTIMGIGAVILQRAFNRFGSDIVAATTAASRLDSFVWILYPSIGATVTAFVAQNYGAKCYARIKSGVFICMIAALGFGAFFGILMVTCNQTFLKFFLDAKNISPIILEEGRQFIYRNASFYPMQGMIVIYRNAIQGMGYGTLPFIGGILETCCRAFAAFYLADTFGFHGACFANGLVWTTNGFLMYAAYLIILNRLLKKKG